MSYPTFNKDDFLFGLEFEFYFKSSDQKEKFIECINHQFDVEVLDLTHTQYSEDDEKWILSVETTMPILSLNKVGMEITTCPVSQDYGVQYNKKKGIA